MRFKKQRHNYFKNKNLLDVGDLIRYGEITKQNSVVYNSVNNKYSLLDLEENRIIKEFNTFEELKEYVLGLWSLEIIDGNDIYFNVEWEVK